MMTNDSTSGRRLLYTTATFAVLVSAPIIIALPAYAGPENGVVMGGSASINVSGTTTTIQQSSDRAIIRWDSFDVNAAEQVRFQQPSTSSITVNRITDSKASRIDGRISANGNIVLINPNGLVFGASSVVDVGGLVATSSDLEDDNAFMSGGAVKFTKPGKADARVINNGTMTVRDAGLVGLVAPHVENNGVIQARMGRVQLASGDIHTIDFAGDGLIKLEISDDVMSQSVTNTGTINADGGDVLITAAQARGMVDALITNTGTIKANTVAQKTGSVTISTHGLETTELPMPAAIPNLGTGTIINTGTILTEGLNLNESGGSITILADAVTLGDGSYLSAAADTDGGSIRVGGDYQGGNGVPRSNNTIVTDLATLNVSSRRYGRGGRIILWSDETTEFHGNIEAKGGLEGGDGGFVEVSGKNYLDFNGTVNLLSPHGDVGILLLDPTNISISSGANANVTGSSPYAPNADSVTSVLNVTTLQNALALANVIVQTRATGAQTGNITVDSAITWTSGTTLTLDAFANIIVNQAISGGSLNMIAGTDIQLLANINGTGTLTMQAAADATTVGLGGGAGTFNINATDFPYIQNGWSDIIVGRTTGTGLMTANALTWVSNVTLRSGTGNITIAGIQDVGSRSMTLSTNGTVALSVANALTGSGGTLTLQQATAAGNAVFGTTGGALNMSTTSLGRIANGWSQINLGRTDATGTLTMAGSVTWQDNVTINSNTGVINVTGAQTFGANNVKIVTDGDITLGITNSLYASGGTLTIEQRTANTTIGLGDTQSGTINLTTTEVTRLRDGFNSITIGRADGTGDINIGTTTWLDPLTILSGSGIVNINNTVTTTTNALNLTTQGGAVTATGGISQTTGALTINTNGGNISTAAITQTTGALTMNSGGGSITLGGATAGTTTGAWAFNSGNNSITVNGNVTKTGGSLSFNTGTGQFVANNALSFGAATGSITVGGTSNIAINNTVAQTTGNLTLTTAGGSITTNGSAVMTQTTGNLNMNTFGGAINLGAALTQGGAAVSGNLNLNSGNGLITVSGILTRLAGNLDINSGNSSIVFANSLSLAAANTTITTTGSATIALNNAVSTSTGNLTLTTAGGTITTGASGTITQAGGNLTMDSHGGNITVGAAINATTGTLLLDSANGIILVNGGITKTAGALTVNSGTAAVTMNGALSLAAANFTVTTGGSSQVAINNTLGQSTGNTSITTNTGGITLAGAVTQTGAGNLTLSTNNAAISTQAITQTGGNFTATSTGGSITIGGAVNATTGTMSLDSANGTILVSNGITKTGGALTLNSGTAGITLNALSLGASSFTATAGGNSNIYIGGTIGQSTGNTSLTTNTGTITLANAFTQTGTGSITLLTSGGNITTAALGNTTGTIAITSNGGTISTGSITDTTGNVTLTSGNASIIVGGTLTKTGGIITADSGASSISLSAVSIGVGAMTLITDALALNGNVSGTGALILTQASAGTTIGIGAGQSGTLNLNATEFSYIQDGWSSRTIGRTDGTGAVNVAGGLTWDDTLVLQSGSGEIYLNGDQTFQTSLTIRTDSDVHVAGNLAGTTTFALVQASVGTTMGIGDGQAGTVNLTSAEQAYIVNGWTSVVFGRVDGTGEVNFIGGNWNDSVTLRSGSGQLNINGAMALNGNSLAVTTDSNLYVGGNLTSASNGALTITGSSAATSIGLGDGQTGTLLLDNAELARFGTSWKNTYIGSTTMTADMNIGSRTWDTLILRTGTGIIHVNGTMNMGANALTIYTDSNMDLAGALTGTGTLTISSTILATSFGLGDGQSGTIQLSDAELDRITNGWGSIVIGNSNATGAINVGARTWNDATTIRNDTGALNINGAQNALANNLTLSTNSNIALNATLTGTGILTLTPTDSTAVGVGTGQAGTFGLTDAELDNIATGWTSVIIGNAVSTAAMNIAGRTWNNSMDFRVGTGALNINGAQNLGANNLTLRSANDLAINQILAGTGTLTILNSGTTAGYTMAIGDSESGNMKLTNAELANFVPYGWTNLSFGNTGSTAAINVGAYSWNSNVTFRNAGGGININGQQDLSAGKNLTITSNGDIAINQNLNGTGTLAIGQTSATITMAIGDSQTGTLKLTNAELGRIGSGWNDLIFGTTATTTSTYGTLKVGAYTWNNNVTFRTSSMVININEAQNSGSHNLSIITNVNPVIAATLTGTGTLTVSQQAANVSMGVGGTGTVNLDAAELSSIVNGWGNLVFGRADGTATMNIATRTWNDNVTFMTGTGALNIAGANMGANNLTLATNSSLGITGALTGTGNLTIHNASGNTQIAVGDGQAGTVALSNAELVLIADGWNNVTIGSTTSFGNINIGARNWVNKMTFVTQGNIVINGAQTTTETSGTTFVFATTGGAFINNVGVGAINPGTGRYLVYSVAEANDTINGLIRPTIVTNQSYAGYGPGSVVETGDVFIYSGLAAKILFLQIDDVEKAYGDANPVYTYTYIGGLQNGDLLSSVILSYSLSAAGSTALDDAGTTRTIMGSFNTDLGYSVQIINGTLTVVKATLTVTADSDTRIYGETNPSLSVNYAGFKNGDSDADLTTEATAATGALITSNVGNYAITASGGADDNYDFVYVDGNLAITKATLTATSQNATREYGDTNPAYSFVYTGFKNGETQSVIDTLASGSAAASATSNVGNYAISGSGASDNNYSFTYVNTGNLSITKAMLTATTQNATREYGLTNPTLNAVYTGFKNGETQSIIDSLASISTTAAIGSDVGSYGISGAGASDNNYNFTYVNTGNLSVTKAMLTATAQNASREYGDANPGFTLAYTGFRNGDTQTAINSLGSATSAAIATSDVGTYSITGSGAVDNNYDFTYVNGTLTVNKAMLTATTQNATREYGLANPTLNVVYTGFKNSETQSVINTLATASTSAVTGSDVGSYGISSAGAADNNYDFTYVNSGNLSVTKATLTATAQNASRDYGDANPGFSIVYTGFRNSDTQSVINSLGSASSAAIGTTGVGTYAITASGASDNNYDFNYVNGTLTINKAILTVTADNATREYGLANPGFSVSYSGFKNSETSGVLTTQASASSAATAASNVNSYAITASGAADDNYDFSYVNGTLSITKATLTATAGSGTREYGDANPAFGVTYTGFRNGNTVGDIDTQATASSTGPTGNVGAHSVTASGGLDNNYTFSYVDGVLTVTKATATVTANNSIRQIGTANPVFTATYSGLKNGETAAVIDTLASVNTTADLSTPAGTYALAASGAIDNNYNFIYVDGVLTLTVDPLAVPVVETPETGNIIPPTVDNSLDGRYIYQSFLYPVGGDAMSYPASGIMVISEDQIYNDRDTDDKFLIAVTEEISANMQSY